MTLEFFNILFLSDWYIVLCWGLVSNNNSRGNDIQSDDANQNKIHMLLFSTVP